MEIGMEMDGFSLQQYKKILFESTETLTEFKEKRLEEEIRRTEGQIELLRNKLSVMTDLKTYNELKKKGYTTEQIEQQQISDKQGFCR